MSFGSSLLLGFARLRRKPLRLLGVLLMPLAVLIAGLFVPQDSLNTPLEAGISLPEQSEQAQALWQRLNTGDPAYVSFHLADEEEIYEQVAAGKWVCGFILRPDFDSLLSSAQSVVLADVVQTQAETMAPLLCEAFSAAVYHLRAPELAATYAAQNGLADGATLDAVRETVANGAPHAMQLRTVTVDGQAEQAAQPGAATARAACQGFIAIFLFFAALLLASELDGVRQEGWFSRTAAFTGRFPLQAGLALAQMLPLAVAAGVAHALGEHFFAGTLSLADLSALAGYGFCLSSFALFLGQVPGIRQGLSALLPFVPAVCLLLCPIFFDVANFFAPAARISHLLPPTWLLDAFAHPLPDCLWLWGMGLAFAAAAMFSRRLIP